MDDNRAFLIIFLVLLVLGITIVSTQCGDTVERKIARCTEKGLSIDVCKKAYDID